MNEGPTYTDAEILEIERFLRDSYLMAASTVRFARASNVESALLPEKERLKRKKGIGRSEFGEEDLRELDEAINSPYAPELQMLRERGLKELASEAAKHDDESSLPALFLKHFLKRLCQKQPPTQPSKVLITSGWMTILLQQLQIPPFFAPVIVWLATKLRDTGVPAFCSALRDFLKQET